MSAQVINLDDLIFIAARLLSEPHGSNPEYDRALAELVCDASGDSLENAELWLSRLRAHPAAPRA